MMANAESTPELRLSGAVDPLEEERARLETDIAIAKARLLAAQHAAAQLDADTKQALRQELAASRDELAELERGHEAAVREVRESAASEVERILETARRQAAEIEADAGLDGVSVGPTGAGS